MRQFITLLTEPATAEDTAGLVDDLLHTCRLDDEFDKSHRNWVG